jgi:superfamily II DNA or RNA helicase
MGALRDLLSRLDPDSYRRGKQFEHICKWFLTNDPTYKSTLRHVWLWDEWVGRWGGDAGIDLVAEDHDGRLWAIQAKAYAPENTVTKADVDKFLAESSRSVFSYRLLIATTDKLHHVARRTINDQEKQVAFVGLADLATSEVRWPRSPTDLRPSPLPKPARPRDHQREAITNVVKGFKDADRGQLIMACGTGKTLTSLFIKEKLDAERTLVLVPSLSLLKQTMQVWRVNAKVPFEALPVCSDETVGRSDEDAAVAHTSELGVPVTTDPHEIGAFLRRRSGPLVVFSTYQSSPQIAAAFAFGRVPAFDMVVADEAHRIAGPVSSDFATVLDATSIKARRRLFMTATPRYFTGRVLKAAQDVDLEVASMDAASRFGTVFHRLTFGDAIKRGRLTDYQVAVVGVDNDTYRDWADKGTLVTRDGKKITDARTLAGQIGLAKAMRKYDLHRTISFHSRVAHAREFASDMPEVIAWMPAQQRPEGALWSSYASGEMTAGERHVRLQHLSRLHDGQRGLLTNARCLSEGVDVPTLDGVAFIDPRRSEVDIVQAVGRVIRKSGDKTVGTIVIPVFINTDEDPEIALDSSVFKPVWDVVKALRAHDEELGGQLDELRRELGRRAVRPRLPAKIHMDLPARVGADFARAFEVWLVEQTTASWEFWLGLLERYIRENGSALVPAKSRFHGHNLGAWVNEQRTRYMEGTLTAERMSRLADLDGWTWDARDAVWEEGVRHLEEYVEQEGNAIVPITHRTANGYKLGQWVSVQRTTYEKGIIAQERRERLDAIPGWTWNVQDYLWEQGFRHYEAYIETHGNALVPLKYTSDDGYQLGAWVNTQKVKYGRGTLPPHREQRLRQLPGWSWSAKDSAWADGFSRLLRYVKVHRQANVPQKYVDADGYPLGSWVTVQRGARKAGRLKPEREARLSAVPGWNWNPRRGPRNWDEPQRERLRAAMAARKSRGLPIGRPRTLTRDQIELAKRMRASGQPVPAIAETLGVSRTTLYRTLAERG